MERGKLPTRKPSPRVHSDWTNVGHVVHPLPLLIGLAGPRPRGAWRPLGRPRLSTRTAAREAPRREIGAATRTAGLCQASVSARRCCWHTVGPPQTYAHLNEQTSTQRRLLGGNGVMYAESLAHSQRGINLV